MARIVTFVIAPIGDGSWGIYLNGFLLEEPADEEEARSSVAMRIEGVRERGDIGRLEMAKERPPAE